MVGSQRPSPLKYFDSSLPTISLPTSWPVGPASPHALAGLARGSRLDIRLADLARMLFCSCGVMRTTEQSEPLAPGRTAWRWFRTVSSAGGCHPLEVYVCAISVTGLDDGIWHYEPFDHSLTLICPEARSACASLVVTGIPWRTTWRYAERGYRHLWWDAGTMTANLLAAASSAGLPATVRLGFPDHQIASLVGAVAPSELPLAVVILGQGELPGATASRAVRGDVGSDPESFPLIVSTHQESCLRDEVAVRRWCEPPGQLADVPGHPPAELPKSIDEVIVARGSHRRFDPGHRVPASLMLWALGIAAATPPWDAGQSLIEVDVIAHDVGGLSPGLYAWQADAMRLVRAGADRQETRLLCLDQAAAAGASAVLVCSVDLESAIAMRGERGYRSIQFAAGLSIGRLYLALSSVRLGCCALTCNDEWFHRLVAPRRAALLSLALGMPHGGSRARPAVAGRPRLAGLTGAAEQVISHVLDQVADE